jgi:3-oxoadipate enol-lactonase/4-carboxymuconolactone decarboxylase
VTVPLRWRVDGPDGAPVLVLLNSVGATTEMWTPCLGPLVEHYRVVRVDARGHGASPASPAGTPATVADLGADVLAVLDELGAARVHLAGLSLGGMTAMWLAIHHPERIARLALLCTSAYLPPAEGWIERASTVRTGGMVAIADTVIARWITPGLARRDPAVTARLARAFTAVDAESYAQCCEAIAGLDLRADLGRIAAPTLVIAAADDPATPVEPHAITLAENIAGARLVVLPDAAHVATVEQPGAVAAALLEHLGGRADLATGNATRRAVLGEAHVDRAAAATTAFTAPFQDFITRYAWGEVWTRPGLVRRERSIATLAALVSLGAEHEIGLHVRAALTNGLSRGEIAEVLLHTAVYAGVPRANRAFAIAQSVLAELDATAADAAPAATITDQPDEEN